MRREAVVIINDESTESGMSELREGFGVKTDANVVRKSIAFAREAMQYMVKRDDKNVLYMLPPLRVNSNIAQFRRPIEVILN